MKRMLGSTILAGALALGAAVCWCARAQATVTSPQYSLTLHAGAVFSFPLQLSASQAVAGVNGELSFNAAHFTNVQLVSSPGNLGFTVLSNSPSAGKLRFVVYADPTASLNLAQPVFYFQMQLVGSVTPQTDTLSYTIAAASSPTGVSLSNVTFNNVLVVTQANAARDWEVYE